MNAFRLIPSIQVRDALSGAGAALSGGRWNRRGRPAVYAATTASLALLEVMCNSPDQLGSSLSMITLAITDEAIEPLDDRALPGRWWTRELACQAVAETWFARASSAVLCVPSTIHAHEDNLVLNPLHRQFRHQVVVVDVADFPVDERLRGLVAS